MVGVIMAERSKWKICEGVESGGGQMIRGIMKQCRRNGRAKKQSISPEKVLMGPVEILSINDDSTVHIF